MTPVRTGDRVHGLAAVAVGTATGCLLSLLACPTEPEPADCDPGMQRPGDGAPCVLAIPPAPCPAGARAEPGSTACLPVGPAACAAGFAADDSGWGCAPVLPAAPCTGATRETLGSTDCTPLGDCTAEFPPADATHLVDTSLADAAVDATHFRTLSDALATAPGGAVIAVERGVYREALTLTRDLRLVGRCAAEVIVENPGIMAAGLRLASAARVQVQGLTVRGHRDGALVTDGELHLREVVLEANREAGVVAYRGRAVLERCAVRGNLPLADGSMGRGLDVEAGAEVDVVDSAVAGNADAGCYVSGGGSRLALQRSVVRETVTASSGGNGRGLIVRAGASASVEDSALLGNRDIGLFVAAATAEVSGSVIADTRPGPGGFFGQAVELQQAASARIESSTLSRNRDRAVVVNASRLELLGTAVVATRVNGGGTQGLGLFVSDAGEVLAEDVALVDNQAMGVGALGAGTRLTLRRSLVGDTRPDRDGAFGHGLAIVQGPEVELERCELRGNAVTDLFVVDHGARVHVERSLIRSARHGADGQFGFGALAIGGAWMQLVDSRVQGHASVGVGYADAAGALQAVAVLQNPIGMQAQSGALIEEVREVPATTEERTVYVSADSVFWDNATRLGSGDLPLPAVPTL